MGFLPAPTVHSDTWWLHSSHCFVWLKAKRNKKGH